MMKDEGYTKANINNCLSYKYRHHSKDVFVMLLVYAGENIIRSNYKTCVDGLQAKVHDKFKTVDRYDICHYLGI